MRSRQGHSLERLSKLAGVSRAMLSQIETGKSVPTISLLLKVANALGVPIANLLVAPASRATVLLPKARAKTVIASNGRFASRALFPPDGSRRSEHDHPQIPDRLAVEAGGQTGQCQGHGDYHRGRH